VGAAGGSWAQPAMVSVPNNTAAAAHRILEARRANGIY
jgi:hypothetical protein